VPAVYGAEGRGRALNDTLIKLGAQNMHWEQDGAYTGEISARMLRDLFCRYVILGHSERRQYFKETDAQVNRKTKAALASSLVPIVCVGETLPQREAGEAKAVVPRAGREKPRGGSMRASSTSCSRTNRSGRSARARRRRPSRPRRCTLSCGRRWPTWPAATPPIPSESRWRQREAREREGTVRAAGPLTEA